jgi:hypothetical protein
VCRCLALAATEPQGLLNDKPQVNNFFCAVLRSESPEWTLGNAPGTVQAFLDYSAEQGLQALVFEKMHTSPAWQTWPLAIRESLGGARLAGVAVDLLRAHRVAQCLAVFEQHEIACLLTKGEALAHTLYPEPGLRPRVDSDIFIRLDQIDEVCGLFEQQGYELIPPIYKTHQFMAVKCFEDFILTFDVHWRILNSPRFARIIGFSEAFARAVPVPGIKGGLTTCPVDTLLLACMHRSGSEWHDQQRLLWLYDIHLMVLRLDLEEWDEVISKAKHKGVQSIVRDSLNLAAESLASPVPDGITARLEPAANTGGFSNRFRKSYLALLADDWVALPDYRSRFRLLKELLFPSQSELEAEFGKKHRYVLCLLAVGYVLRRIPPRLGLK